MRSRTAILIGLFLAGIGLLLWLTGRDDVGETRKLPDGSTFQLVDVVFTATNYTFNYRGGRPWLRFVAPILPQTMQNRLSGPSGNLGGHDFGGITNLLALTVHRPEEGENLDSYGRAVGWLRVSDENGNAHEAIITGGLFNPSSYSVCRWNALAFSHRGKTLILQFLAGSNRGWSNAAEFRIANPLYAKYPQWTAEALPNTKHIDTLAVTLNEFRTWTRLSATNMSEAARTRLVFLFAENATASEHWAIQKLTISDATGNRRSPNLTHHLNWTTNGTTEFFGALWPGEHAWKLQVEVVRTVGFEREQLWEVHVPLPSAGAIATLTNHWAHDGVNVELISVASPKTDHAGDFQSIAKWWGPGKQSVWSLALRVNPKAPDTRLHLLAIKDQDAREIKIMEHRAQDFAQQAVFFKPPNGARSANLTFALQRSRFVKFLARPEFGEPQVTGKTMR